MITAGTLSLFLSPYLEGTRVFLQSAGSGLRGSPLSDTANAAPNATAPQEPAQSAARASLVQIETTTAHHSNRPRNCNLVPERAGQVNGSATPLKTETIVFRCRSTDRTGRTNSRSLIELATMLSDTNVSFTTTLVYSRYREASGYL